MADKEIKIGFWNNSVNSYPEYPMPEEEGQHDNTELAEISQVISECAKKGAGSANFWDLRQKTVEELRKAGYSISDNLQDSRRHRDCYTVSWKL